MLGNFGSWGEQNSLSVTSQEPAQEPEGARLATEDNASSQLRLSIPAGDSSLTVVGLECADAELRAML